MAAFTYASFEPDRLADVGAGGRTRAAGATGAGGAEGVPTGSPEAGGVSGGHPRVALALRAALGAVRKVGPAGSAEHRPLYQAGVR